jgi:hypothetical protein
MMLQAGGPPDTSAYYHAAYIWAAVLYAGYVVALWTRGRRLRSRLRVARERTAGRGA